jgi:hypothetical protein
MPIQNKGKILVLHILIFKFLERWREDKRLWTEWYQKFPKFELFNKIKHSVCDFSTIKR